jgi:hypothetical protein
MEIEDSRKENHDKKTADDVKIADKELSMFR